MAKILFIISMIIFAFLAMLTMIDLKNLFFTFENIFLKFAIVIVSFFTFIIIFRYVMFIFFSILKTTQKTIDFNLSNRAKQPRVTIVVPAYNEEVTIAVSIKSLVQQTYKNLEIIIMDDGSKDATYKISKKFEGDFEGKKIKVLTKKNGGKSRALNFAIERSSGELIMCVDADSKLEADAVELMTRYFQDKDIVAVAGSVFVSNRINIWTKLQALEYIEGLNMVRNAQAFLKLVNIIPGPIGMFRKDAILEVGGYAHDTFAEDADLTLKLIKKNYKIEFEPEAVAHTEAPDELLDLLKQRYRWTRGILQAIRKHSKSLWTKKKEDSWNFTIVLWYMLFEAIFWPFMDLFAMILLIYISVAQGASTVLFYWWSLFTVVDVAGALYCILITNETKRLAFYAIYYRLYFISVINISKIFATIEEWFNIEMSWGKLDRKGI
jgi:cellulose synthase/poly-beta-1,6-N-acetylglucosamine synthase-like glycosyltransferase